MKTSAEFNLAGAFKIDLISGNTIVNSTDWFSNFITQTGLLYPTIYPFVDCFRFLSIGTSSASNTAGVVGGNPTTGLSSPITGFQTTASPQIGTYIGYSGYDVPRDGAEPTCGTVLTENGPRFYRAWVIPTGDSSITVNEAAGGLTIQEFMVSPSSGSDPTGKSAFSRITRTITVPNGHKIIVSYQLSINIKNTGVTYFGPGTFTTGNADVTNDQHLVSLWSNLSGYYRQVYHGLQCIDVNGAHYIPKYGAGMEPSLSDFSNYSFYLSPDNAAFDISSSGNKQIDINKAYLSDGLMGQVISIPMSYDVNIDSQSDLISYYYGAAQLQSFPSESDFPEAATPSNIRVGNNTTSLKTPWLYNYALDNTNFSSNFNYQTFQDSIPKEISFANPGLSGIDDTKSNFHQKSVFSSKIYKLPFIYTGSNMVTGRKKTITRKTLFSPVSSLGYNTRFASLVYAFQNPDGGSKAPNKLLYPMMDSLFFDTSGQSLMQHYRLVTVEFLERGTGIGDAYLDITPHNENIGQFKSRRTMQGPINGGSISSYWFGYYAPNNQLQSGVYRDCSGANPEDFNNGTSNSYSGWGAIIGAQGDFGWLPFDCGLTNHTTGIKTQPSYTGIMYWPTSRGGGNSLSLQITGVKYYTSLWGYGSVPLSSGELVTAGYNWSTNPYKFCPPSGRIINSENFGSSGYRLLPNYGIPNNFNINYYYSLTGGEYPALSFDNGLELYMDIIWSSKCGGASDCIDPT